jgi:hypothetical protein
MQAERIAPGLPDRRAAVRYGLTAYRTVRCYDLALQARANAAHSNAIVFHSHFWLILPIFTLSPPQAFAWFFMAAVAMKDAKLSITPVPHPPARMHCAAVALPMVAKLSPATKATETNLVMRPSVKAVVDRSERKRLVGRTSEA